jgi:hypothetical protein
MEKKKYERILEGRIEQTGPYHGDLEIVIKDKHNDVYSFYISGDQSTLDSLAEVIDNSQGIYGKLSVEIIKKIEPTERPSELEVLREMVARYEKERFIDRFYGRLFGKFGGDYF